MWEIILNIVIGVLVAIALYQDADNSTEASSIAWIVAMVLLWFKVDISITNTALLVIPYMIVGLLVALVRWNVYCRNVTSAALSNGYVQGLTTWSDRSTKLSKEQLVEQISQRLNPANHRDRLVGMVLNWPIGIVVGMFRSIISLARWCVNGWSFSMFNYLSSRQINRIKRVQQDQGDEK